VKSRILVLLFSLGCIYAGIAQNIPVNGALFGRPFQTNVDHELAKTMLTNPGDSSVVQLFSNYGDREINNETLSEITKRYSMDVATLYFVNRMYEQEKNRQINDHYLAALDTAEHIELSMSFKQDFFIVFVPGFRYRHIHNGSDFCDQRLLLDSIGVPYEMIDINETGLVEGNAQIIADRLQELNQIHRNIIIISVSKGGLETAMALGKYATPQNISSVKGWINVCGILKGTPVADYWAKPFKRFLMGSGLFWAGIKVDLKGLLTDLSYETGKEKYKHLKIPPEINTVSLIATPLARQKANKYFTSPNDGFSPLVDEITEDGLVIIEMGLNHFFENVDLNIRMIILLNYLVTQIEN
jgi:hypothetical protein